MQAAVSPPPESGRDALEAKMTELCGHINAAEAGFLKLARESIDAAKDVVDGEAPASPTLDAV